MNALTNPTTARNLHEEEKSRAADEIYQTLKQDILRGDYGPGETLSPSTIASRFEVSRMPVREALNKLAFDRLVQDIPQRGYIVRTVSFSEAIAAFRLRELLEVEAAGEAARRISDSEIELLKQVIGGEGDIVLRNYNFHLTVARISGNRLLADFVEELLMLTQCLIVNHPQVIAVDYDQEIEIIDALATRNPETAREAMRQHIQISVNELFNNH